MTEVLPESGVVLKKLEEQGGLPAEQGIESLVAERERLDTALIRVWQARTTLETYISGDPQTRHIIENNHRLRTSAGLADSTTFQTHTTELQTVSDESSRIAILERQLFALANEEGLNLSSIPIQELPPELFATPDNPTSLAAARTFVKKGSIQTLGDLFTQQGMHTLTENRLHVPMVERLLESVRDSQTIKLGIESAKSGEQAHEYIKQKILVEKNRNTGITFTPSYENAYKTILNFMLQNGNNRKIARAIVWGPPGRGKTEFFRAMNKLLGKETIVISGRPYLGFEELVGAPKLVSSDRTERFRHLAQMYNGMDDYTVAKSILALSHKYIEQLQGTDNKAVFTEAQEIVFRTHWLQQIAGLPLKEAEHFATMESLDETYDPRRFTENDNNLFRKIKSDFLTQLTGMGSGELAKTNDEESADYMAGLILTADRAGMNVVIDEAEKIYGEGSKNQSFAGLEDLLTKTPGSTVRVGNINHRLSDDFYLDLTMNSLEVPQHVKNRYGTRSFYFEEEIVDRLGIGAVQLTNAEGAPILSPQAEEKVVYLFSNLWRALDQKAKKEGLPLDLRTLQGVLSALIHQGKGRGVSVAEAVAPLQQNYADVLAQFPAFLDTVDVMAYLEEDIPEELPVEEVDSSPLQSSLIDIPVPVLPNRRQLRKLPVGASKILAQHLKVFPPENISDSKVTKYGYVAKQANMITCLTAHGGEILHQVPLPAEYAEWNLKETDAWGSVALLTSPDKSKSVVIDIAGISGGSSQPISEVNSHLSPDGKYLFSLSNGSQTQEIIVRRLEVTQKTTEQQTTDLRLDLPGLPAGHMGRPTGIEFTSNGNYAVVRCTDQQGQEYCNILLLADTYRAGKAQYLLASSIPGHDWKAHSFESILYLINTADSQEKGLAIT